jgi:hypothetical protein
MPHLDALLKNCRNQDERRMVAFVESLRARGTPDPEATAAVYHGANVDRVRSLLARIAKETNERIIPFPGPTRAVA